jgi:hypothetical protein
MKKNLIVALCLYALMFTAHAFADIYKCTGDGGAPTFVDGNTKANYKNCQLIIRDNTTQSASSKQTTAKPSNFPKVDKQTQHLRDDKRKEILLSELDTEQKALETAKNQSAKSGIEMHQKNIQLLQKEVNALK